jgi:hypothetical protein
MKLMILEIIHILIATIVTYLFMTFLGRKISAFYILAFNLIHQSYLHIRIMSETYGNWSLGIETCYMMSICKFSSIVFNYEDGGRNEEELECRHFKEK